MLALFALLALSTSAAEAPCVDLPSGFAAAPELRRLPSSALEERLWRDLARRLEDPAAFVALVEAEAPAYYEGQLFPYVLPVLALASLCRQPDADRPAIRAAMATLIDLLIPQATRRLKVEGPAAIPGVVGHGTWRGELALALSAWRLAEGDDRYEALHGPLCAALLAELQAREGAPIDAYPGLTWTFDTVPALLALRMRDRAVGLPGAEEAVQAHLRWSDAHLDPATGLPVSRLDLASGRVLEGPRGADLGLRVLLMAQLDRARAEALYAGFVEHFSVRIPGMEGFAEWPDGQSGRMDGDSGLVIGGLGMSATGFGLGAARVMRDEARFARLDAELVALPRLLAPMLPLVTAQAQTLRMRLDTETFATGLLLGDLALLFGVSWAPWGVDSADPDAPECSPDGSAPG